MTPNILLCFFKTFKIIILSLSILPCLKKCILKKKDPGVICLHVKHEDPPPLRKMTLAVNKNRN